MMLKGKTIFPLNAATQEDLKTKADLVDGKVPASQLPSYVDDVVEYASTAEFPDPGEQGKIYVALDSGFTYRWSGSEYIQIGGQDLSEYYTKDEADQLLATKQPVGDYATNTALAEGLATKQPVGDYATNTALEAGLATKQPVGDYATNTALTEGLATKQPVGDYATNSALETGLATKQDNINDLDAIRSGAALGATSVQPADIANDMEVVAYQTQTPLSVEQLAKAEAGKLAIYKDYRLYTKFTQDGNVVSFQALEHMSENGTYTPAYNVRIRRYTLTLDRSTRMLNDAGYQEGISVSDTADNFLAASDAPAADGKKIIREMNLAGAINEFVPIPDDEITDILENAGKRYIIGFRNAAQSNPALIRTDEAVGASVTDTNGVIEINGIDMSKVWGGYIGNDEEELTWDATSGQYLHNGKRYTGNVFSKINRFFTKASYVDIDGEQVLDGYQLCYADEAPDSTWHDWFLGKPYTKIGCYKARGGDNWTNGLQSKSGLSGRSYTNAKNIATASNLNTSTTATMHMKWYNQNSILQVLFMTLFATRQTEDVFPQSTYRPYNNTQNTGYLREIRVASTCATGYSTSKTGNMFLGIEDFVGYGYECLGGVKLSGTAVQTSLDYDTFNFNNTYTQADININNVTSANCISSLQESSSVPGLLLPKKTTGTETTSYYCDKIWTGGVTIYQGATEPSTSSGVFSLNGAVSVELSYGNLATRLCGEPL